MTACLLRVVCKVICLILIATVVVHRLVPNIGLVTTEMGRACVLVYTMGL